MTTNPLAIIAGGSPAASRIAVDAMRAQEKGSPMAQARAVRAARIALGDSQATFTEEERRAIAEMLDTDRSEMIRLRVMPEEKQRVQQLADEAGLTVSEFIRARIGLARY